jgi:uncharacterized membrane protein YphA (DoxX/SURF4 family)
MKVLLTVARVFVGVLFIFSGLVKANDPLGLSYKMQEFFDVWHLYFLNDFSLALALVMNVFEIIAGVAILIGWRTKLFTRLLFLLIIFFLFLTAYAAFSGKIAACGCFGDCIPLKPMQSFWKDVVLFILIVFLLLNHRNIRPVTTPRIARTALVICTFLIVALQWYVLKHLPIIDCLPYKKGNDLVQQMQPPPGATTDEYSYTFKYKKGDKVVEFPADSLPEDLDESYVFVERGQRLVKKGNDLKANITDLNFIAETGADETQQILAQPGKYVLVFIQQFKTDYRERYDNNLWKQLKTKCPFYIVTADPESVLKFTEGSYRILKCDGTVIKTAARANPTYFVMQGAKVLGKYSYVDTDKVLNMLK